MDGNLRFTYRLVLVSAKSQLYLFFPIYQQLFSDQGHSNHYLCNPLARQKEKFLAHQKDAFAPSVMFSALSNVRQTLTQVLNFALVLSTAFMLWKGLSVATDSPSPIVVVLSGSMEPAFQRGDLLFLWNRSQNTQIGEVVVYNVKGKDIPIVHRVVRKYGGG